MKDLVVFMPVLPEIVLAVGAMALLMFAPTAASGGDGHPGLVGRAVDLRGRSRGDASGQQVRHEFRR
jgi:hypothetical protein